MEMFLGYTAHDWGAIRLMTSRKAMTKEELYDYLLKNKNSYAFIHLLDDADALLAAAECGYPKPNELWPYINMLARA